MPLYTNNSIQYRSHSAVYCLYITDGIDCCRKWHGLFTKKKLAFPLGIAMSLIGRFKVWHALLADRLLLYYNNKYIRQEICCILSNFNSYINCVQNSSYINPVILLLILTYWTFTNLNVKVFKMLIKTIIIIFLYVNQGDMWMCVCVCFGGGSQRVY